MGAHSGHFFFSIAESMWGRKSGLWSQTQAWPSGDSEPASASSVPAMEIMTCPSRNILWIYEIWHKKDPAGTGHIVDAPEAEATILLRDAAWSGAPGSLPSLSRFPRLKKGRGSILDCQGGGRG